MVGMAYAAGGIRELRGYAAGGKGLCTGGNRLCSRR